MCGMRVLLLALMLTARDEAAVRQTLDRYVAAWLAGDEKTVMSLLTSDSVLIPGEKTPYVGEAAIRSYWFPASGPKTGLTKFKTTIDAITGSGDIAIVRGTQVIEWTSGGERWRTRGNYMSVLRRTPDGWRLATQMAGNTPAEKF